MKTVILFILASLCSSSLYASVSTDLNQFFDNLGFASNVSSPTAYTGQRAGYYTGGRVFARNRVRNTQLASMQLPSYSAGCGGIDLFTGGFSFVNSDELLNLMKSIMTDAAGYSFNLALASLTPMLDNVKNQMLSLATEINQTNVNSCQMAETFVGGLWPSNRQAQQQICINLAQKSNKFSDWAEARQGCGVEETFNETIDLARDNPDFQAQVLDNTNFTWQALKDMPLVANDKELAELFMSLSGSIVVRRNDDGSNAFDPFPSLAGDEAFIKALLHGGEAPIYRCGDDSACLNPSTKSITIEEKDTFAAKVSSLLTSMADKILSDTRLSDSEKGLLQTTQIPLYKMLSVQSALTRAPATVDINQYADIIALDILLQYLRESLNYLRPSLETAAMNIDAGLHDQVMQGVEQARQQLIELQQKSQRQAAVVFQLIEQTQTIERMLAGELSSQLASTLQWVSIQ